MIFMWSLNEMYPEFNSLVFNIAEGYLKTMLNTLENNQPFNNKEMFFSN